MYTVTRQIQWPEGGAVVEVSEGGIDYCNPDALVPAYDGEMQEYESPIEAAEAAISICRCWRKDGKKSAVVAYGATGGMTFPFEGCTFDELIEWAKETDKALERCPQCGTIVEGWKEWYVAGWYTDCEFISFDDGIKYCSEYCAEKNSEFNN